jgi:hypothetical protein
MKKIIFVLLILFLITPPSANAAKKRVYGTATTVVSTAKGVAVTPSLRRDHGALLIYFSGLSAAKSVSYELTYTGSKQEQGVFGSIDPKTSGNSASRSLYFGTCSHLVCTPHYGVTNMKLNVIVKTNTGSTITKRYRIKT